MIRPSMPAPAVGGHRRARAEARVRLLGLKNYPATGTEVCGVPRSTLWPGTERGAGWRGAGGPLRACKPLPERLRGPCGWPGFAEIQRARRKASDPFLDQLLCSAVLHGGQHAEPVRQVPLPGAPLGETGLPAPAGSGERWRRSAGVRPMTATTHARHAGAEPVRRGRAPWPLPVPWRSRATWPPRAQQEPTGI